VKGAAIKANSLYFSRSAGTNRTGKLQRKEGSILSRDTLLIHHYHYFLIIIYYLVNVCYYSSRFLRSSPYRTHLINNYSIYETKKKFLRNIEHSKKLLVELEL